MTEHQIREMVVTQVRSWPKQVNPQMLIELLDGFAKCIHKQAEAERASMQAPTLRWVVECRDAWHRKYDEALTQAAQLGADLASVRAQLAAKELQIQAASLFIRDVLDALGTAQPPLDSVVDLPAITLQVVGQIEEGKAQLAEAQRERDEAREQFDRHVVWATLQQGHRAARVSALETAVGAFAAWWVSHREGSPNAAYQHVDAFVAALAPSSPPESAT